MEENKDKRNDNSKENIDDSLSQNVYDDIESEQSTPITDGDDFQDKSDDEVDVEPEQPSIDTDDKEVQEIVSTENQNVGSDPKVVKGKRRLAKGFSFKNMSKRNKILFGSLAALVVLLIAAALILFIDQPLNDDEIATLMKDGVFHESITVNGVSIGGMTVSQAKEALDADDATSVSGFKLALKLDDRKWKITGSEIKLSSDINDVLQEAMLFEKSGSLYSRIANDNGWVKGANEFALSFVADDNALKEKVGVIAKEATVDVVEPTIDFEGEDDGDFTVVDGKNGYKVDAEVLLDTVKARFKAQDFSVIEMEAEVIEPEISAEYLRENTELIGTYTTDYTSNSNRMYNVEKGAAIINGTVIQPGKIFDINAILGPRSYASGWKGSAAIVNGSKYEIQAGGGVCQLSTTVYGAVLRADLEVVERTPHTFPSDYAPKGQDATISTGGPEFKFKNTRDMPIYVVMKVDGKGHVTTSIYGPPHPDGYTVEITSVTVSTKEPGPTKITVDETKPPGYKEKVGLYHKGYTVKTYKTYYKDGEKVGDRIYLYTDVYPATRLAYIVGPEEEEEESASPDIKATADPDEDADSDVSASPDADTP